MTAITPLAAMHGTLESMAEKFTDALPPQGINLFSELYYKAIDESDWTAARYTVFDTDSLQTMSHSCLV